MKPTKTVLAALGFVAALTACGELPMQPTATDSADAASSIPNVTSAQHDDNTHYWVNWTSANAAGGTASGTITLGNGTVVAVTLRVADPAGPAPLFGYRVNGSNQAGIWGFPESQYDNWWSYNNPSPYTSAAVPNLPGHDNDIIALAGGNESGHPLSSYVITFTPAVQNPVMAILSLGSGGNPAVYDFDRPFEILSQGPGRFGGGSNSLTTAAGEQLWGREGNGTIRFTGSFSTFSWTVPDGEVWHGFTLGVRGPADPNADSDGDGVPDSTDNCPLVANADQGDSDGDGIGNACDSTDDGDSDTDGDGLTNSQEQEIGTSPTNPDTDGDGHNDGVDAYPLDPSRHLPNAAPTADAGGPYAGNEGSAVAFDGSASSDPDGDALTYAWTFGDGGTATGATASHTYADDGTYTVTLTVDDGNGATHSVTTTAEVGNVAPAVDAGAGATIVSGEAYSLGGSFTDPGADSWTSSIDWGDGSGDAGTSGTHTYYVPGTYTVTLTVEDDDGGVGSASVEVVVVRKSVAIDIKPGSDENPVNVNDKGVTPVAVLTTADFDATSIDRTTIRFGAGAASPVHGALGHVEDVDGDGDDDLMTHFETGATGIQAGDVSACLTGVTVGGVWFEGCDVVRAFANENNAGGNGKGKGKKE